MNVPLIELLMRLAFIAKAKGILGSGHIYRNPSELRRRVRINKQLKANQV